MAIDGVIGEAAVLLRGDGSQFPKDAENIVQGGLQPAVSAAAKLVGGIFIGHKAVEFAREGVEALSEIEKASLITTARIAATGGAAGITAEHVHELADAGAHLIGINDTAVVSAENLLLGFDGIGASGGVFDRAIAASENLSVATGQDLTSAVSRLGLALQSPTAAAGLLRREHVVLTAAQKEAISSFVRVGDTVKAQGVVLDAIDHQVGGLALKYGQSLPGQLAIAKVSLEEAHVALTQGMAPALLLTASAEQAFGNAIVALPGPLRTVTALTLSAGTTTAALIPTVSAAIQGWRALFPVVQAANVATAEGTVLKGAEGATAASSATGVFALGAANRELAASEVAASTAGSGLLATLAPYAALAAAVAVGSALIKARVDEGSDSVANFSHDVDVKLHGAAISSYDDLTAAIGRTLDGQRALEHGATINPLNVPGDLEADAGRASLGKLADSYIELQHSANDYANVTGKTRDEALRLVIAQRAEADAASLTGAAYDAAAADLGQYSTAQQTLLKGADALFAANQAYTASVQATNGAERGLAAAHQTLRSAQEALAKARAAGLSGEVVAKAELGIESARLSAKDAAAGLVTEERRLADMRVHSGSLEEIISQEERLRQARQSEADATVGVVDAQRRAYFARRQGGDAAVQAEADLARAKRAQADATRAAAAEQSSLDRLKGPASATDIAAQEEKVEKARLANKTAILGQIDAQRALTEAERVGTEQDPAVVAARRSVAQAQQGVADAVHAVETARLAEADAAVKQAEAIQTADGSTKNAVQSTRNQIAALRGVEATLAPGNPLRANIDAYISQLERLVAVTSASNDSNGGFFAGLFKQFAGASGTSGGGGGGGGWLAQALGIRAAKGFQGTVNRPTLGLFGENNEPEDIFAVPHSQGGIASKMGGSTYMIDVGGVHFHGVVPTEAEAYATGTAVANGIADGMMRRDVKLAARLH